MHPWGALRSCQPVKRQRINDMQELIHIRINPRHPTSAGPKKTKKTKKQKQHRNTMDSDVQHTPYFLLLVLWQWLQARTHRPRPQYQQEAALGQEPALRRTNKTCHSSSLH